MLFENLCLCKHSIRKLKFQPVETTTVAGLPQKYCLFYILDRNHGYNFLIDTRTEVSVLPLDPKQNSKPGLYKFQATNGTKSSDHDLGMRWNFLWIFNQANTTTPILGADFLAKFNLLVNMTTHFLVDNLTEHSVRKICSRYQSTGISSALLQASGVKELIQKYVEITQPFKNTNKIKHNAKHYIKTTGQLIHSTPSD